MKKLIIIIAKCLLFLIFISSCDKPEETNDPIVNDLIIKEIDIIEMSQLYLPEFELLRERSSIFGTVEYVFKRQSDSALVFIEVGIHLNAEDAEKAANKLLEFISIYMRDFAYDGVYVGDKFWWYANGLGLTNLTNIFFIRYNAAFEMNCGSAYDELLSLAKNIDDDILSKASYITFEN